MIPGYENFIYLGYTLGGTEPTLYFAEGRYTQVHSNPNNVGWHPVRPIYHGSNVLESTIDAYHDSRGGERELFIQRFFNNEFETNDLAARFFELSSTDGQKWISHKSRARLMRVGAPGFDNTYDTAYAKEVLRTGHFAANNH